MACIIGDFNWIHVGGYNKDRDHLWTYIFIDNGNESYCMTTKTARVLSVAHQ